MKVLKTILNTIINILIVLVLITSILIAVFALTSKASGISTIFGYTIQSIQTDSMKGGSKDYEGGDFEKGDVIIGKATGSATDTEYEVGDIVTYLGVLEGTDQQGLICHRIVDKGTYQGTDIVVYQTKGDYNFDPDQQADDVDHYIDAGSIKSVFYSKDYHGTVIKGLGNVLDFIQSQLGFFLVVLLPMIIFFLYELIRVIFNAANYRAEKKKEAETEEDKEKEKDQQAAIDAAVAEALKKRDAEHLADNTAEPSAPQMSAEEYEEFKRFQEFKKQQEQQNNE